MTAIIRRLAAAAFVTLSAFGAPATAEEAAEPAWYGTVALEGHDVTSFHDGAPVEGSAEFATEWDGAEWRFASQDSLDAFEADPEKFVPRFGGYCPVALARGDLKAGTVEQFTVAGEELYFTYDQDNAQIFADDQVSIAAKARFEWGRLISGG